MMVVSNVFALALVIVTVIVAAAVTVMVSHIALALRHMQTESK